MYSEVPFDARIGTHTRLPKFVSGVPSNEQLFRRDFTAVMYDCYC